MLPFLTTIISNNFKMDDKTQTFLVKHLFPYLLKTLQFCFTKYNLTNNFNLRTKHSNNITFLKTREMIF